MRFRLNQTLEDWDTYTLSVRRGALLCAPTHVDGSPAKQPLAFSECANVVWFDLASLRITRPI